MSIFIIAELSCNHNGSKQKCMDLIHAAKESGATAAKIQIFEPSDMTLKCDSEIFKITSGQWSGMSLWELYQKAQTPFDWIGDLVDLAKKLDIILFPTIYHPSKIEFAEKFNFPMYKISSFECNYLELIESLAATKKPLILSTGMASKNEISVAVQTVRKHHDKIALLKCTSSYPAPIEQMNLRTIPIMAKDFKCQVGLSDHTVGLVAPIAAVAVGAGIIEKHLCLDEKTLDSDFSIPAKKFALMCQVINDTEKAMGKAVYGGKAFCKRSMVAVDDIQKGGEFNGNIKALRVNAKGSMNVGRFAQRDYKTGEIIGEKL